MTEDNNCSTWIANALVGAGVKVVYGGHGGALVPLVNAIEKNPRLTWVCVRNEANASLMAAAHAKLTNNLACVIATSGPGATNLTTGLMDANLDKVPVIALTGLKPRESMHYSEFQDVDQSRLFSGGGLVFSHDVASPTSLIPLMRDAVAIAITRSTCAHLAIPVDIQAATCPIAVDKPFCAAHAGDRVAPNTTLDLNLLDDIAELVSMQKKRILIAVGLRGIDAGKDIVQLAEAIRAPIVTRLDAKGAVNELHPLVFGVEGVHGKPGLEMSAALMQSAELVLNFGVDDCTLLLCNTAGLQIREMIEFAPTALLVGTRFRAKYTCIGNLSNIASTLAEKISDIPRTMKRGSMERITSTEGRAANGVLDAAHFQSDIDIPGNRCEKGALLWSAIHSGAWIGKRHSLEKLHMKHYDSTEYGHPREILLEISKVLSEDCVVCVDTGDVTLWASLCLKRRAGRTLSSEHLGTMGYALCAGIAAVMATEAPSTSLVLAGDGGFQMTLNELATFVQNKRPGDRLVVIVFDNCLLGRVIFGFDGARGCTLTGPDYAALARAYGGAGYRATCPLAIAKHVEEAQEGLTILHVPIPPNLKAEMATFQDDAVKIMNSG